MAGQSGEQPTRGQVEAVEEAHHSKLTSWIAVWVMVAGFVLGGVGLVFGNWWLFWAGAVVVVVGGIFGLVNGILQDVH